MIDLKALSDYQHHLNSRASDRALREFAKLDLWSQAEVAARWAHSGEHEVGERIVRAGR